jgi:hypothetical protein
MNKQEKPVPGELNSIKCSDNKLEKNPLVRYWHSKRIEIINTYVDKYGKGKIVDLGCREVPWNYRNIPVAMIPPLCRFGASPEQFDSLSDASLVILSEVLKHLDYRQAVKNICSRLTSGAVVIGCVPYVGPFGFWLPLYRIQCYLFPGARGKRAIGYKQLRECFIQSGMEILEERVLLRLTYFILSRKIY